MSDYNNTKERQLRLRISNSDALHRRWRAIALLLAMILIACLIVIVLQCAKLP